MEKLGSELEFISQIHRDGSGCTPIDQNHWEVIQDTKFDLSCLSLSERTFIASGFNSFVVRLKPEKILKDLTWDDIETEYEMKIPSYSQDHCEVFEYLRVNYYPPLPKTE